MTIKSSRDHTVLAILDLDSGLGIYIKRSTVRAIVVFKSRVAVVRPVVVRPYLDCGDVANIYACGTTITAGTTIGCSADSRSSMLMQFRCNHVSQSFGCRGFAISNRAPQDYFAYAASQTENRRVISSQCWRRLWVWSKVAHRKSHLL
jgi:hypothetical protein